MFDTTQPGDSKSPFTLSQAGDQSEMGAALQGAAVAATAVVDTVVTPHTSGGVMPVQGKRPDYQAENVEVKLVQEGLTKLGLYSGPLDGVRNAEYVAALNTYSEQEAEEPGMKTIRDLLYSFPSIDDAEVGDILKTIEHYRSN
jgi:hypothetical protein